MHELIVNDWLDHDYIAAPHRRLGRAARARAAVAAGPRRRGVRRAGGADRGAGARLRHHQAGGDPAELRHAAGARRRQRGARHRLPAGAGRRLARAGGRPAAEQLGPVPGGPRGAAAARPAGRAPAAHHQHEHHRRCADCDTRAKPPVRGAGGLQQQPGRGGAGLGARWWPASRARTCSPWCWSSSRPTPPTMPTTCCRPPRSSSTGTSTPATATPTCCSTGPAVAPRGEARSNAWVFRELARRMGFDEPCFSDDDEALCRSAFAPGVIDVAELQAQGFTTPEAAGRALRRRQLPHALGPLRVLQRTPGGPGQDGLPDHVPNYEAGRQLDASFRWR